MKRNPLKFTDIKLPLSREAMEKITARSEKTFVRSSLENSLRNGGIHQTNGRRKKSGLLSLSEAYRRLSRRECEVLDKMAEGKTNRKIANELFITLSTVEKHITCIGKALRLFGRGSVREWINNINKKKS